MTSSNSNLKVLRARRLLPENATGYSARTLLLAYGLIRGKKMERLESPHSCPHTFFSPNDIVRLAMSYYRPMAEGETEAEYEAGKKAFQEAMVADITAWRKQITIAWITAEPKKQARNRAARSRPMNAGTRRATA